MCVPDTRSLHQFNELSTDMRYSEILNFWILISMESYQNGTASPALLPGGRRGTSFRPRCRPPAHRAAPSVPTDPSTRARTGCLAIDRLHPQRRTDPRRGRLPTTGAPDPGRRRRRRGTSTPHRGRNGGATHDRVRRVCHLLAAATTRADSC